MSPELAQFRSSLLILTAVGASQRDSRGLWPTTGARRWSFTGVRQASKAKAAAVRQPGALEDEAQLGLFKRCKKTDNRVIFEFLELLLRPDEA